MTAWCASAPGGVAAGPSGGIGADLLDYAFPHRLDVADQFSKGLGFGLAAAGVYGGFGVPRRREAVLFRRRLGHAVDVAVAGVDQHRGGGGDDVGGLGGGEAEGDDAERCGEVAVVEGGVEG